MKIFNSIGHFFAWLAVKLTGAAATINSDLTKFEGLVATPLAQAIAKLDPAAAQRVTNAIIAIGGDAFNVALNAGEALAQGGLNVTPDVATVKAVEQAIADIRAVFAGQTVPVQQTTTQPIVSGS